MTDPTAADYALVDHWWQQDVTRGCRDDAACAVAFLRAEYEAKLADERKQQAAALESERWHADAMSMNLFADVATRAAIQAAHAARRAAEKEAR